MGRGALPSPAFRIEGAAINMNTRFWQMAATWGGISLLCLTGAFAIVGSEVPANAATRCKVCGHQHAPAIGVCSPPCGDEEWAGEWYWMRSPEQEQRVVAALYNRYCIRCHGVDGRGVWDIPDVPNFTNARWQASRSDGDLARLTLEGRGAVMPPFRGTLTLEEASAMARYLRMFVPGTEASRPDFENSAESIPAQPTAAEPVLDVPSVHFAPPTRVSGRR